MSALLETENKPAETLGQFVRRIRLEKGLTQSDVEERSGGAVEGISGPYVARIENGKAANPSGRKLAALARGLGVHPVAIFAFSVDLPVDNDFEQAALFLLYRKLKEAGPEDRQFIQSAIELLLSQIDARQKSRD